MSVKEEVCGIVQETVMNMSSPQLVFIKLLNF